MKCNRTKSIAWNAAICQAGNGTATIAAHANWADSDA